jgi:transposase InsO family protein
VVLAALQALPGPIYIVSNSQYVVKGIHSPAVLLYLRDINPHGLKENHIWQTDVTHIPQFGTLKYVHVTVDTHSHVLFASAHTGETTKHALGHLPGASVTFGIPKSIKMDNCPAYTSKKFQEFCKLWDISHNTGIPYNPHCQSIVEQQHQRIKN